MQLLKNAYIRIYIINIIIHVNINIIFIIF